MNIKSLDHLVITTHNLEACLHFYVDILGMEMDPGNNRYAVRFGNQKFNIHTKPAEFCLLQHILQRAALTYV